LSAVRLKAAILCSVQEPTCWTLTGIPGDAQQQTGQVAGFALARREPAHAFVRASDQFDSRFSAST